MSMVCDRKMVVITYELIGYLTYTKFYFTLDFPNRFPVNSPHSQHALVTNSPHVNMGRVGISQSLTFP